MAVSLVFKSVLPVAALLYAETSVLPLNFKWAYEGSKAFSFLPKAFAFVIVVNIVATSIVLILLGMKVSSARTICRDKAQKDGDKDAEERFSYPKLYAEGFSTHAKVFNCTQRGHQQALETYTQFVLLSLIGGFKFPFTTAIGGVIWCIARLKWAEGYSSGEPSQRYANFLSRGIWTSLIIVLFTALGTASSVGGLW
jgi:glutathione S-transferase